MKLSLLPFFRRENRFDLVFLNAGASLTTSEGRVGEGDLVGEAVEGSCDRSLIGSSFLCVPIGDVSGERL